MEQYQVLAKMDIKPDPRRMQMPAEALSGERPQQGQQTDPMKQAESSMKMKQSEQSHKMNLLKQAVEIKTAMDTDNNPKRPYPAGMTR